MLTIFMLWVIFLCKKINDTTLYAEKIYSKNFIQPSKKFVLSLHYNGDNSYLFVNGKQELINGLRVNQKNLGCMKIFMILL